MINLASSLLVLNGFIALMMGLLCGIPLGRAINGNMGEERVRAWRVAHSALLSGGVMSIVFGTSFAHLALSGNAQLTVSILTSVSIYAFAYALVFGAVKGYRGLEKEPGLVANTVYYANVAGALLSVIAVAILVYGAWRSFMVHIAA